MKTNEMKTVYIIAGDSAYDELFQSLGFETTRDIRKASLVVFTGGEDVSAGLYGHEQHPTTYNNVFRDQQEARLFEIAVLNEIPCVGICRGAQFLNVMSGGEMYQDVDGHGRSHMITDATTGETVFVSSTHHQMMKPSSTGVLVAYSTIGEDRIWWDNEIFKKEKAEFDYEVVYYEHTKSLCFQPHPEFNSPEYEGMKMYFKSLLERYYEAA